MSRPTVASVGRPNVGKSTLFNRIIGGRRAIVHHSPGVTRDRHFARGEWAGRSFWLVDTGGWIVGDDDPIARGIREQVSLAIDDAEVIVLVVDTQAGVHPADLEVAEILRAVKHRVVLAANKADDLPDVYTHHAFHELGIGEPVAVSAATGKGSGDLLDRIAELLSHEGAEADEETVDVAVVGRPNVGKSSLVNRLVGSERSIVTPQPGTTRDAIDSPLRYHGQTLNFIDTAGLRRRPKVKDDVEFYSALRAERAIDRAQVCVLVVDAADGVHGQDIRVAQKAWEGGRGLIVAVNKWDLVADKETATAERGRKDLWERVPFFKRVPFVYTSALTGFRARKILDLILRVDEERRRRIDTSEVNRVLERLVARAQPPQAAGREVKLLYASQIGTAPPTFAIVSNRTDAILESYKRYLVNGFYDAWGFEGSPIRLKLTLRRGRG